MYKLLDNYYKLECGRVVEAVEVGVDWIRISHRGSALYIPMAFVEQVSDFYMAE